MGKELWISPNEVIEHAEDPLESKPGPDGTYPGLQIGGLVFQSPEEAERFYGRIIYGKGAESQSEE